MSEELMIRNCSPTLAGMKTGNIFVVKYKDKKEMHDNLRKWNKLLLKKGVRVIPLRYRNGKALIYVYRPKKLSKDLNHHKATEILKDKGYCAENHHLCVKELIFRLSENEDFPHEIGLFLGYPPEDVCGFIENRPHKCIGCWKVYDNEEEALKTFKKYKKCTNIYRALLAQGKSIEKLTVAG